MDLPCPSTVGQTTATHQCSVDSEKFVSDCLVPCSPDFLSVRSGHKRTLSPSFFTSLHSCSYHQNNQPLPQVRVLHRATRRTRSPSHSYWSLSNFPIRNGTFTKPPQQPVPGCSGLHGHGSKHYHAPESWRSLQGQSMTILPRLQMLTHLAPDPRHQVSYLCISWPRGMGHSWPLLWLLRNTLRLNHIPTSDTWTHEACFVASSRTFDTGEVSVGT